MAKKKEDIEIEEIEYEDESLPKDKIKKLREKLKKCEQEKREYLEGWQRMKADAVNEKKRLLEQIASERENGRKEAVSLIIPVLDSFEMAFQGEAWDKVDDVWKKGVEYIHKQFESVLQDLDVTAFGKEGDVFDPSIHESIKEVKTDNEKEKGHIAKVLRSGYKFKDEVIRVAQVEVFV